MWTNPQFPADLVTFTKEILNGKLHFLCNVFSLYTKVMLILILINVYYLQNVIFSFEKGLIGRNHYSL